MTVFCLLVICIWPLFGVANAHVSFTFPPARSLALDYIITLGFDLPCGMPKGPVRTTVKQGSLLNVTWHLGFPHRGGFRLQILDNQEKFLMSLTNSEDDYNYLRHDFTAQSHEVQLPSNFTCNDCTLQILRQADDLSKSALFFSCADIDIVPGDHYEETCFNHGSYVNSQCECEKNFYGDRCQYADDCSEDQDCGPNGKCIDHGGSSMPHKQCYCQSGWFGERCDRESSIKTTRFDSEDYRVLQVLPDFRLHWRILQDTEEIEVVAQVNGTTWVGVGWRPLDISPLCQMIPHNYKYDVYKNNPKYANYSFHPMDCNDFTIGTARGTYSRVLDYFSRNKSTPRLDSFYSGKFDLTAANGYESPDGVTTIMFRKKLRASEQTDHSIENRPMHVVYAHGQEPGNYIHKVPSGVESGPAKNIVFYERDELKFHGHAPKRGHMEINFFD